MMHDYNELTVVTHRQLGGWQHLQLRKEITGVSSRPNASTVQTETSTCKKLAGIFARSVLLSQTGGVLLVAAVELPGIPEIFHAAFPTVD